MAPSQNPIRRLLDLLAKMGLSIRDDPPRVVDLSTREWGLAVCNLALSTAKLPSDDPDAVPAISVVLRNTAPNPVSLQIAPWLAFYAIEVTTPDNTPVPLTPYGRELLKAEKNSPLQTVTLQPGAAIETQVPVGAIFAMVPRRSYRLNVTCVPPGSSLPLAAKALTI